MWIALKFFVLLQSKQRFGDVAAISLRCELLSNFLYFCSRNNKPCSLKESNRVVNCSQIFCTFAVETTWRNGQFWVISCELLSNFLYFCSRNNLVDFHIPCYYVVNCSQIFCTFAVETTIRESIEDNETLWIALKFFVLLQSKQPPILQLADHISCELLSNFLYFCSRNNLSFILYSLFLLWIALKFFVLLQSKQPIIVIVILMHSCELLSNFLYFCSRNNSYRLTLQIYSVVNCSQIFCTFAVETTIP